MNSSALEYDLSILVAQHPSMEIVRNKDTPIFIQGIYQVLDKEGQVQGEYKIRVWIPDKYPHQFPFLEELSNKIERTIDRHISSTGLACVELTHKAILRAKKGIAITDFFVEYVHKYLCWQILYDNGYREQLQEWEHGDKAIFDFYKEILNVSQLDSILSFIKSTITTKKLGPNQLCPCLSGRKIKNCHVVRYATIVSLGKDRLLEDYMYLKRLK